MITSAGITSALITVPLGEFHTALIVISIAAGASILSHVNDSGFWLVSNYLGLSEKDTFRSWSMMTLILALCGFTTVILNSCPVNKTISDVIYKSNIYAVSVLSGNRNFEGRISPHIKANYLASPPLVVAYALAGHMEFALYKDPLGRSEEGKDIYLKDIWPTNKEIEDTLRDALNAKYPNINFELDHPLSKSSLNKLFNATTDQLTRVNVLEADLNNGFKDSLSLQYEKAIQGNNLNKKKAVEKIAKDLKLNIGKVSDDATNFKYDVNDFQKINIKDEKGKWHKSLLSP